MNTAALLREQRRYVRGSYKQFLAFGGPCVYFHRECLAAGQADFLSHRHLEMLYATLTSWGMHRMGGSDTKLTDWDVFQDSLHGCAHALEPFRRMDLLNLSPAEYSEAVLALAPCYRRLRVSKSEATVVANSKTLYHLLPRLIPPIDRQYTVRFFRQPPKKWRDSNQRFKAIMLPSGTKAQFALFHSICTAVKALADRVEPSLLRRELAQHGVTAPKAIDNTIVNFVRLNSGGAQPAV